MKAGGWRSEATDEREAGSCTRASLDRRERQRGRERMRVVALARRGSRGPDLHDRSDQEAARARGDQDLAGASRRVGHVAGVDAMPRTRAAAVDKCTERQGTDA